jgi:hypothetical protein
MQLLSRERMHMQIFEQLEQWKVSQVLIELQYIVAKEKKTIYGRILSVNTVEQNILFYNDDKKAIENVYLSQIEDIIATGSLAAETNQNTTLNSELNKKHLSLKEEIIQTISSLTTSDLNALFPLIKHLAKSTEK